jgi:hypothetical protein
VPSEVPVSLSSTITLEQTSDGRNPSEYEWAWSSQVPAGGRRADSSDISLETLEQHRQLKCAALKRSLSAHRNVASLFDDDRLAGRAVVQPISFSKLRFDNSRIGTFVNGHYSKRVLVQPNSHALGVSMAARVTRQ